MITFDGEPLFGSEAAKIKIGPVKLRHAVQQSPGSRGMRIDHQGAEARRINQSGVLVADSPGGLQLQVGFIESKIDGLAYTLVDGFGRVWSNAVLIEFDVEPFERVGARWKAAYRAEYLQVIP